MIVATGFFDGVHLGHRLVISELVQAAHDRHDESMVITFWPHPRNVLQDEAVNLRLLTSLEEKKRILSDLGVDRVEVIHFTKEFSQLTTEAYLRHYVMERFSGKAVLLGYDNRIGCNPGTPEEIAGIARSMGLDVIMAERVTSPGGVVVSSTKIREALSLGNVDVAAQMLGYRYSLFGVVVCGNKLGRTLGYPTANMQLYEPLKLIPGNGVYAVEVETLGRHYGGMCNVGVRPTLGGGGARTVETNIFDFEDDIYGLDIKVTFVKRIRAEQKFDCLDSLKVQLASDEVVCRSILG